MTRSLKSNQDQLKAPHNKRKWRNSAKTHKRKREKLAWLTQMSLSMSLIQLTTLFHPKKNLLASQKHLFQQEANPHNKKTSPNKTKPNQMKPHLGSKKNKKPNKWMRIQHLRIHKWCWASIGSKSRFNSSNSSNNRICMGRGSNTMVPMLSYTNTMDFKQI